MKGPGFESSHQQLLLNIYLLLTVCRKDENKEKRPGMAHLKKRLLWFEPSTSVTRWLDDVFDVWPFTSMKICPNDKTIAKVRSRFRQILKKAI